MANPQGRALFGKGSVSGLGGSPTTACDRFLPLAENRSGRTDSILGKPALAQADQQAVLQRQADGDWALTLYLTPVIYLYLDRFTRREAAAHLDVDAEGV